MIPFILMLTEEALRYGLREFFCWVSKTKKKKRSEARSLRLRLVTDTRVNRDCTL